MTSPVIEYGQSEYFLALNGIVLKIVGFNIQ